MDRPSSISKFIPECEEFTETSRNLMMKKGEVKPAARNECKAPFGKPGKQQRMCLKCVSLQIWQVIIRGGPSRQADRELAPVKPLLSQTLTQTLQ